MTSPWAGARVLVLGGTGFIGQRAVQRWLLEDGVDATVLVRTWGKAAGLARYPVRLVGGDAADAAAVARAAEGVDFVVDLTFPRDGTVAVRREVARTAARAVVEGCAAAGVKRLVHTSTIAVFGTPRTGTFDANRRPIRTRDAYAEGKRAGEEALRAAADAAGLEAVVLRPTIVYGPQAGWSAGTFAWLARSRLALADGGQGACNAVYVDDVVDALRAALLAPRSALGAWQLSARAPTTWGAFYTAHADVLGIADAWEGMATDEIARRWKRQRKTQRPLPRFVRRLREDGSLRSDVLSLPGIRHAMATVRGVLPRRAFSGVKQRLLAKRDGLLPVLAAAPRKLDLPPPGLLALHASRASVDMEPTCEALGWQPRFALAGGMVRTAAWARWARLAPRHEDAK